MALWSLMLLGFLVLGGEVRADCTLTSTGKKAVTDMGLGLYYKDPAIVGGLYPNLSNQAPAAHLAAAMNAASFVRPLNGSGQSDPVNGRIVMISIGVSNTSQEFEIPPKPTAPPPEPRLPIVDRAHAFMARANADASKNPKLVIVNGAQGGTDIVDWSHDLSDPTDPNPDPYGAWATVDTRLNDAGVSPSQVQVVWVKHAHTNPQDFSSFPTTNGSDSIAYFQHREEQVARNVKLRFPNAKLMFITSRTRAYKDLSSAGHGSREPYTYEGAFANRALIEQQINYGSQPGSPLYYGNPDPAVNDGVAPVVMWGPYVWVDGLAARSDGMTWLCNSINPFQDTTYPFASAFLSDTRAWDGPGSTINDYDYKHPGGGGIHKVASQLLAFFKTRPYTAPWYLDTSKVLLAQSVTASSGGVTSGVAPLTVQFTAAGSDPANVSPKIVQYAWDFDDGTSRLSDLYSWDVVNGGPPAGGFAPVEVPHDSAAQNPSKTFSIPGTYTVRMTATDVAGNTATKTITITVTSPSPAAPTVSLASPEPGSVATGTVAMRATATDFDGTVASVKFYADGALVGTGTSVGGGAYTYSWTTATPGAHDVVATATDNAGLTKTSFGATVTVNVAPPNQPPIVAVNAPFAGTGFVAPANIVIDASASDSDGALASVSFYAGGVLLGAGTPIGGTTYRYTWTSAPQGSYSLTATATDDLGLSTTSAPIAINVYSPDVNSPPSVALTAPVAGASFLTPAGIQLSAVASDAGGFVSSVAFYVDGVNVGAGVDAGSSTYSLAWIGGAAGAHSLIAVATDNAGLTATSAAVAITVAAPAAAPLQCTTYSDGNTTRTSVRQTISCNQLKLTTGPSGTCTITAPPPCAGTIVADSAALAHGANNPPAAAVNVTVAGLKKQYECQSEIARAIYNFVGDKILDLTQGYTPAQADALLAATFDPITNKCTSVAVAQDPSGVVLPSVGAQCSAYVGAVGSIVNPAGLQTCLRATVEPWIRKIGNYKLPTVALTGPAAGSSYTQPVNLTLSATAGDTDGTVSQVAFYADGTLLGNGTNAAGTYSFLWNAAPAGSHAIAAVATDSDTLTTVTPSIAVTVNRLVNNQAPTVSLTAPVAGATFLVSSPITITATANDADGLIGSVGFYDGAVFLGLGQHLTGTTYQLTWSNAAVGTHDLTAVATDNGNMTATSGAASIRVLQAPSVAITSPASGTPFTTPVNVTLVASASDVDGTVSSVQFYDGGVLLGAGTPSGGTFTYVWNSAPSGVHAVTAIATDNDGLTATAAQISLPISAPAQPPVVSVTSPAAGAVFTAPTSITIDASATSAIASIVVVGFYADGTYLGDGSYISGSTYRLVWSNAPAGTHQITAVAIDDGDRQTTSAVVTIAVHATPTVTLTAPLAGASFTAPATVNLVASASDSDGTIANVKFYSNGSIVGLGVKGAGTTYSFTWTNVPSGTKSMTAIATDNDGLATTSTAAVITVVGNAAPTVAITSPGGGASFTAPATVTIAATAADSDGTLSSVSFYEDGVLLGAGVPGGGSAYSYVWSNAPPGAHSLTVSATDNGGATTTSAAVAITVRAPPTVAMTGPAEGATFTAPASVSLVASASDSDGTVSTVRFYADGVLVGTGTNSGGTYTYVWSNVPVGGHSVVAIATDSDLLTATSAARSFVMNGSNLSPVVSVTSPAVNALFTTPDAVTILVSASDPEGALGAVAIKGDGVSLSPVVDGGNGTFSAVWLGATVGAHSLTATATDATGIAATSAPVAITVSAAPVAPLQCVTTAEGSTLKSSLSTTIGCNQNKLQFGVNTSCSITSPPACAGTVVAEAAALSHGPNNPPAATPNVLVGGLKKQFDCQAQIAKGVINYIGNKVNYLVLGSTPTAADSLVSTSFDGVGQKCTGFVVAQDPTGVILPQVGPSCAAYVGGTGVASIGATVDVAGLTTCLRNSAEVLVRRIGNYKSPTVTLTGPAANASFPWPASVTLSATAADTDGTVSSVSFYADGALVGAGALSAGTYSYVWNAPVGAHAIVAAATDSDTLTTKSTPIAISVIRSNVAPSVSITSPAANAAFTAPAAVAVTATATDSDGTITGVTFYGDGVYLGAGLAAGSTYSFTWSGVGVGSHSLIAVAVDNGGLTKTSTLVGFSVTAAPVPPPAPGETPLLDFLSILLPPRVSAAPDADWAGSKVVAPEWSFGVPPPRPLGRAAGAASAAASPRCTSKSELEAVWQSAAQALECDKSALGSGASVVCSAAAPPPCARAFVARTLSLAFGPNDPPGPAVDTTLSGLDVQFGCQAAIADAVSNYVGDRLDRLPNRDADADVEEGAAGAFDAVLSACEGVSVAVDADGVMLPAVGAPCDAAVGSSGALVDAAELRACLHAQLASWVSLVAPRPASAFARDLRPYTEPRP